MLCSSSLFLSHILWRQFDDDFDYLTVDRRLQLDIRKEFIILMNDTIYTVGNCLCIFSSSFQHHWDEKCWKYFRLFSFIHLLFRRRTMACSWKDLKIIFMIYHGSIASCKLWLSLHALFNSIIYIRMISYGILFAHSSNHDFSSWRSRHLSFLHESVDVWDGRWRYVRVSPQIININAWFQIQDQSGRLSLGFWDVF
jgi:hypothetical protein